MAFVGQHGYDEGKNKPHPGAIGTIGAFDRTQTPWYLLLPFAKAKESV